MLCPVTRAKPRPRRRTQEQSRAHILNAADEVFRDHLPDAVGLREIAEAADVSHGLVTHYFQTYDGLVSATIARRLEEARASTFSRVASATYDDDETPLLSMLLSVLEDRTLVRLLAWAFLTGRGAEIIPANFAVPVVDALENRVKELGATIPRERLELGAMMGVSAIMGWAVFDQTLERIFGRTDQITPDRLRKELNRMLRAYIQTRS